VDPRAGLDNVKRIFLTLLGLKLQPRSCPAHSQSLYQLRYSKCKSLIEIPIIMLTEVNARRDSNISGDACVDYVLLNNTQRNVAFLL
jgi:hypothetical protein